jgi:hypothetical protein
VLADRERALRWQSWSRIERVGVAVHQPIALDESPQSRTWDTELHGGNRDIPARAAAIAFERLADDVADRFVERALRPLRHRSGYRLTRENRLGSRQDLSHPLFEYGIIEQ